MKSKLPPSNSPPYSHHPPLGAHTSIAGGVANALYAGKEIGCDVIQLFSKNQMQWQGKELSGQEIDEFHMAVQETGVYPVTIHDAYLINLASPNPVVFRKSYNAFIDELKRCESLGVPYLVMHPGAHLGEGEQNGLNKIAGSIHQAYHEAGVTETVVLLETTAGQGTSLGYRFEQIKYLLDASGLHGNIGVCMDTCHIFAAGYDLRTDIKWCQTKEAFHSIIGLEKLKIIHLNDSKKDFGSRVDRHKRIGKGKIGLTGFRVLVNDRDLHNIPMILEIAGGNEVYRQDILLLRSLKK
jgi:deoxyribonuclease-4